MATDYIIFKVNDDYIVAETAEQALNHHLGLLGNGWYSEGDRPEVGDVEQIPMDREGCFEREDGQGYVDMTFGEWLANFEYTVPQVICWNE